MWQVLGNEMQRMRIAAMNELHDDEWPRALGDEAADGQAMMALDDEAADGRQAIDDVDGDGSVGASDLGLLFSAWGACP